MMLARNALALLAVRVTRVVVAARVALLYLAAVPRVRAALFATGIARLNVGVASARGDRDDAEGEKAAKKTRSRSTGHARDASTTRTKINAAS